MTLGTLALVLLGAYLYVNAPVFGAWWYARQYGLSAATLPVAEELGGAERILVLSPHPDDEVLCCAGMIQQAIEAGSKVWILHVTAGDAFELAAIVQERRLRAVGDPMVKLGERRMEEARAAAAVLGVPEDHVSFLGFPDRGLRTLVLGDQHALYRSRFTLRTSVPYLGARSPGLAYTGFNLTAELRAVIDEVQPTLVFAPTPRDAHSDHRAVGQLVMELLEERGQSAIGRWWIVHGDSEWPLPKGVHLSQPLFPPLRARTLPWERFDLEPRWVATKLLAIDTYRSQVEMMRRFLVSFARRNELISSSPLSP